MKVSELKKQLASLPDNLELTVSLNGMEGDYIGIVNRLYDVALIGVVSVKKEVKVRHQISEEEYNKSYKPWSDKYIKETDKEGVTRYYHCYTLPHETLEATLDVYDPYEHDNMKYRVVDGIFIFDDIAIKEWNEDLKEQLESL